MHRRCQLVNTVRFELDYSLNDYLKLAIVWTA